MAGEIVKAEGGVTMWKVTLKGSDGQVEMESYRVTSNRTPEEKLCWNEGEAETYFQEEVQRSKAGN
ncbi:MAG: hypothetical protein K1X67_22140 [Fimbriimonadaceae bacterium]|nr:hypothetical protein [Fimbriimonadaceae bacterium]